MKSNQLSSNNQDVSIESPNKVDGIYEQEHARPSFFHYIPSPFRFDNDPIEATGLTLDMFARATVIMAGIFLGPALLELATAEAMEQCDVDVDEETCAETARIHGFKPSSLLTNIAIVSGIVSNVLLPLVGAVVDHTSYRRQVGSYSAILLVAIKGVELFISPRTWFAVACLQTVSAICFQIHILAAYAYSSELSSQPTQQSHLQSYFFMVMYASTLLFMLEVLIPGALLATDDVGTARIGVVASTITCVPFFTICWQYLFRNRPASSRVPPNQSLLSAGFTRLRQTSSTIQSELPAVRWFLRAIVFSEAGDAALPTIATTYMSGYLGMSSLEIGLVMLMFLIGGIPGTWCGRMVSTHYNPVLSAKAAVAGYMISTTLATLILRPETKNLSYVYAVMWGISQGWMHPQHTAIFVTITPQGQEVELMGLYLFAVQILNFLPPLLFTVLNEAGLNMNWGMASLNIYFALGLLGLFCLGDYQEATAKAQNLITSSNNLGNYERPLEEMESPGDTTSTKIFKQGDRTALVELAVLG
jgi:UMF1 family MFS transporter